MSGPEDGILKGKVGGKSVDEIQKAEEVRKKQLYTGELKGKGLAPEGGEGAESESKVEPGQVFVSPNGNRCEIVDVLPDGERVVVRRLDVGSSEIKTNVKTSEILGKEPTRSGGYWTPEKK
jgi:hypothetical protein